MAQLETLTAEGTITKAPALRRRKEVTEKDSARRARRRTSANVSPDSMTALPTARPAKRGIRGKPIMLIAAATISAEIGIRIALGAGRGGALRLVLNQGLGLTAVGLAIGLVGAIVLTRFMSRLLFGVSPTDPETFGLVTLLLIFVAAAACYVPARRAAGVDPLIALRYE